MVSDLFLQEASAIIAERQREYGDPAESFVKIARKWSVTLGVEITAAQVALCMIDLKTIRLGVTKKPQDSLLDIVGYAVCTSKILED